jgi:hypothetical protein
VINAAIVVVVVVVGDRVVMLWDNSTVKSELFLLDMKTNNFFSSGPP